MLCRICIFNFSWWTLSDYRVLLSSLNRLTDSLSPLRNSPPTHHHHLITYSSIVIILITLCDDWYLRGPKTSCMDTRGYIHSCAYSDFVLESHCFFCFITSDWLFFIPKNSSVSRLLIGAYLSSWPALISRTKFQRFHNVTEDLEHHLAMLKWTSTLDWDLTQNRQTIQCSKLFLWDHILE